MRVHIETPFKAPTEGKRALNVEYARTCLLDSLARGEAPFASHLLYPQVLSDDDPGERARGIEANLEWLHVADKVVVYQDHGISEGMWLAITQANRWEIPVEYRSIE